MGEHTTRGAARRAAGLLGRGLWRLVRPVARPLLHRLRRFLMADTERRLDALAQAVAELRAAQVQQARAQAEELAAFAQVAGDVVVSLAMERE